MYKVLTVHILRDKVFIMKTELLQIQMPADLKEKLRKLAIKEHRSLTSEALTILEAEVDTRLEKAKSA